MFWSVVDPSPVRDETIWIPITVIIFTWSVINIGLGSIKLHLYIKQHGIQPKLPQIVLFLEIWANICMYMLTLKWRCWYWISYILTLCFHCVQWKQRVRVYAIQYRDLNNINVRRESSVCDRTERRGTWILSLWTSTVGFNLQLYVQSYSDDNDCILLVRVSTSSSSFDTIIGKDWSVTSSRPTQRRLHISNWSR
jgi:hypothetical protein